MLPTYAHVFNMFIIKIFLIKTEKLSFPGSIRPTAKITLSADTSNELPTIKK